MHSQTVSSIDWLKWLLISSVLGTAFLIVACDRTASHNQNQTARADVVKIEDVTITAKDLELMVQYRTQTPSGDCKAQAAEMPKVWDQVVKARLNGSRVERVTLFPEDPSLQSVSYHFTKNASGQWTAVAPCSFGIPAR
jgi:hypothetical protein